MAKILVNDGISAEGEGILKAAGHEVEMTKVEQDNLKNELKNYDAILVRSATKVRKEHIESAPDLKLIGRGGVGLDNIDVDVAKSKGIAVINTPAASSDSVAELALAHMFALARWLPNANVTMRKGEWNKKQYKGVELAGKTLLVVGFGRIGQSLARKCAALGMHIIGYDVIDVKTDYEFTKDLDSVLPKADFVSLHVPKLGKPLVDSAFFGKMKDGAYLINCARGGVIDEAALVEALNSGKLAGTGLDVFEKEPSDNMALINHPKVSVTPHIGAQTSEAQDRVGKELAQLVVEFFAGK
ncbi:MAG: D-2-hydroxyacid dehydrogenase [bacterium]